jgi:heat shock protein HtpX
LAARQLTSFLVAAFALATVLLLLAYFFTASLVIKVCQAHPAAAGRYPFLFSVTKKLAAAAKVKTPKIYLLDNNAANALVVGQKRRPFLLVTTGLLEKLSNVELEAVVAYELSQIKHYLTELSLAVILIGFNLFLADLFLKGFWFGPRNKEEGGLGGGLGLFVVIGFFLSLFNWFFLRLLRWALTPNYIYLSDAHAVYLTKNKQGLAAALIKVYQDKKALDPFNQAFTHLFFGCPKQKTVTGKIVTVNTIHPPLVRRLQAIKKLPLIPAKKAA